MSNLTRAMMMGAAGAASGDPVYVDDIFSTSLWTGDDTASRPIVNGIDNTKGGLVWAKDRENANHHQLYDTERTEAYYLDSSDSAGQGFQSGKLVSFNNNGFSIGNAAGGPIPLNYSGRDFVGWNFRKSRGFFDVVTWSGSGTNNTNRRISHSLGSVPGMILVKKRSSGAQDWYVYHRSVGVDSYQALNNTSAFTSGFNAWGTSPTSTDFGINEDNLSTSSGDYVAYVFAHDDASFGTDGDESIIKCGSYSSTGFVNLGWEPQWIMIKSVSNTGAYTGDWRMFDNMRGIVDGDGDHQLFASDARAEDIGSFATAISLNATGFTVEGQGNYGTSTVYMAIRRPHKPPELATDVFAMDTFGGTPPNPPTYYSGFPVDFVFNKEINSTGDFGFFSRPTGLTKLRLPQTYSALSDTTANLDQQNGFRDATGTLAAWQAWMFKRAPGFMDVVVYEGAGGNTTNNVNHNLGVSPEMIIVKNRDATSGWPVYHSAVGLSRSASLQSSTMDEYASGFWSSAPTSTQFFPYGTDTNNSGGLWIAYLFATLPGISKVGSYDGSSSDINVDCGFINGARFVLIKRTDTTGDWCLFDTLRGISSGNDPVIKLNSTSSQDNGNDLIDPLSSGFTVVGGNSFVNNVNAGAKYLFLAIA